jgi:LysR family nitrogen assimilation transcriptional regulator
MIEFHRLRFLAAIIGNGSFHQAAATLGVEQSALSRSIAKLERVFGAQLVIRSRSGATPTTAGSEFIQSSRQLIAIADRMLTKTQLAGLGWAGSAP